MNKLLPGIWMFLLSSPLFAAVMEMEDGGAASAMSETVSVVWVALFAVLFFGLIGYFFWYLMACEKRRKLEE